jgi:ABC-type branched-subunit amino acid transport system ATPase component
MNDRPLAAARNESIESEGAAASSAQLLTVEDIYRSFGGVRAVSGASFTVAAGTITGLIGPNGAGKSTVISLISGQLRPASGRIRFEAEDITALPPDRIAAHRVIRTFQTPNLFGRMTVMENLLLGAPAWGGESVTAALLGKWTWRKAERLLITQAREVLARFRMGHIENEYAANLSGGQKRIVEIMRALMAQPRLLLLDEPMAGVNPTLAQRIADHLADLRSEGITMLMVEHELAVVERLCDPVIVMAQGCVLAEGSMAELRSNREVVNAYLAG